jgi:hypothetical protein
MFKIFKFEKLTLLISALIIISRLSPVHAQDLEPRAYTNIPVGLNFVVAGYAYSAGGVLFDPAVPLENANIKIHGTVLAYARSIKVGRMSGKVDIILPYAWLSGTADFQGQPVSREISGLGDPRVRMSVNFIGAPALPLSGFKDYKQDLVAGASLQIYLPVGQYDPDRLVNIGTNRFSFKPELGISKTLSHLQLELTGGASVFSYFTINACLEQYNRKLSLRFDLHQDDSERSGDIIINMITTKKPVGTKFLPAFLMLKYQTISTLEGKL